MSRTPRARGADARAVNTLREYVARLESSIATGGLSTAEVQALIDTSIASLESSTADDGASEDVTLEQGASFPDPGNDYLYVTFGEDGNWEAIRFRPTAGQTSTGAGQTGSKPTTLGALQLLSYPTPA